MKRIFFLLLVFALFYSNAQAEVREKAILFKPVGIPELNDRDLTIKNITPGSAAEQGGLIVGDRIKSVNMKGFDSYTKLMDYLNTLEEGKKIVFRVRRKDKEASISVTPENSKLPLGFTCTPAKYYTVNKRYKEAEAFLQGEEYAVSISNLIMRPDGILYTVLEIRNLSGKEVTFDPEQVRVLADGVPLKRLSPEGAIAWLKKEKINQEMDRYPVRKYRRFKTRIRAIEKFCAYLEKQALRRTNIYPYEAARGVIIFDNPFRVTKIEINVTAGEETFATRFNEFMEYSSKE